MSRYVVRGWAVNRPPIIEQPECHALGESDDRSAAEQYAIAFIDEHRQRPHVFVTVYDMERPVGSRSVFSAGKGHSFWPHDRVQIIRNECKQEEGSRS